MVSAIFCIAKKIIFAFLISYKTCDILSKDLVGLNRIDKVIFIMLNMITLKNLDDIV